MRIKFIASFCALTLAALMAGCADGSNTANTNTATSNTVATTTTTTTNTNTDTVTPASASNNESTIAEETDASGNRVQTRTFKNNRRVSKVVVMTTKAGKRTVKVYPQGNGAPRDLPEGKIENALEASGDAIADAAGFVADKAEDAANATKKGINEIGDKAEDAGDKAVKGAKVVGDKAEDVGGKAVQGAKKVGEKTVEGAKKAGSKIKDAVTP